MKVPDLVSGGSFIGIRSDFYDVGKLPDVELSGFLEKTGNTIFLVYCNGLIFSAQ
jgi:hypothetical protein